MNQAGNKKVRSYDIFVKVLGKKKLELALFEKVNGSKMYFVGGSSKSRILHFKGENATRKKVREFLKKFGFDDIEIL